VPVEKLAPAEKPVEVATVLLSVTLSIAITSRPTFDPVPVGHAGTGTRSAAEAGVHAERENA
jgi:hypothetical protein